MRYVNGNSSCPQIKSLRESDQVKMYLLFKTGDVPAIAHVIVEGYRVSKHHHTQVSWCHCAATKKKTAYFPLNPGWLIWILISWFIIMPI